MKIHIKFTQYKVILHRMFWKEPSLIWCRKSQGFIFRATELTLQNQGTGVFQSSVTEGFHNFSEKSAIIQDWFSHVTPGTSKHSSFFSCFSIDSERGSAGSQLVSPKLPLDFLHTLKTNQASLSIVSVLLRSSLPASHNHSLTHTHTHIYMCTHTNTHTNKHK